MRRIHDFKSFIKANKVKDNEIIYIETDRSDVTCYVTMKERNDKKGERMTNTSTTEEFARYLFDF